MITICVVCHIQFDQKREFIIGDESLCDKCCRKIEASRGVSDGQALDVADKSTSRLLNDRILTAIERGYNTARKISNFLYQKRPKQRIASDLLWSILFQMRKDGLVELEGNTWRIV